MDSVGFLNSTTSSHVSPSAASPGERTAAAVRQKRFRFESNEDVTFEGTTLLLETSERPFLIHRDSEFTVGSDYDDGSTQDQHNNLNAWQGAALLTAECLGTGLLALPADIQVLGTVLGVSFLIANLPINYYAGYIFHKTACAVEVRQRMENRVYTESILQQYGVGNNAVIDNYQAISDNHQDTLNSTQTNMSTFTHHTVHHDTATFDFIGMTLAVFRSKRATRWVMLVYYVNIFLVLGNYILVQSHAVQAAIGEDNICLPAAGLVAATGMFVVNQTRTMAQLGRTASIVSLAALLVVVLQCLWEVQRLDHGESLQQQNDHRANTATTAATAIAKTHWMMQWLRKCSATGSIGFACGSQKLFLNIRHELQDRSDAPFSLAITLVIFGVVYVGLCLAAGPKPPPFLFDLLPVGTIRRRVGGILLWVHVVVSYTINVQALCSSMDRLLWRRVTGKLCWDALVDAQAWVRWMILTLIMAVLAYTIANAIPFFTDLVSLIGAVTSVPLTLLLPAMFWRQHLRVPLLGGCNDDPASLALTYFATIFMVLATVGSMYAIRQDWSTHGPPFACH